MQRRERNIMVAHQMDVVNGIRWLHMLTNYNFRVFRVCALIFSSFVRSLKLYSMVYLKHKNGIFFRDLSIYALCIRGCCTPFSLFYSLFFFIFSFLIFFFCARHWFARAGECFVCATIILVYMLYVFWCQKCF